MRAQHNLFIFLAVMLCLAACAQLPEVLAAKPVVRPNPAAVKRGNEDPASQAQALLKLSAEQNVKDHVLAIQTAQQAMALWQTLGDSAGIARTYAQIGGYYMAQSDLPEAIQNYQKALQLWRELNNTTEQAGTLIMLGYIEDRKGEWQNSISLFMQAQSLIKEKDEPLLMGQIAGGLADIFNESGLPENGLIQYRQALEYFRRAGDERDAMMIVWGIGATYYRMGNYAEALTNLQQALASFKPDGVEAAICHQYLGKVYIAQGEYTVALEHLQPALEIYTKAPNPKEAAQVVALMGQIYQQQGELERARHSYQQALKSFQNLSDQINQAAVYYALGRLELRDGNYDAAEDYLGKSIAATEDMRRVSTSSDLMAAFSASVHERYETYIECLMRKAQKEPAKGLSTHAFETSELARARSLAELLRATQTTLAPGLDPQLAQQEKLLRQSLRAKEDYKIELLSRKDKREELEALEAELARLKAEETKLNETIRVRYPSYEQITRPVGWDLKRIQEQVVADDQTMLLEYALGPDKSYVWAVTRNSIRSYELPARAQINEAAEKVHNLLSTMPGEETENELTQAAQDLSRMILSPVAAELNRPRIIVVADDMLNYIPFQFLPVPEAKGEQMVAVHEIINAPSASILGQLRQEVARRQTPAKVLAAFGDPVFPSNYSLRRDRNENGQVATVQAPEDAPGQAALRDVELKGDSSSLKTLQPLLYARRELANLSEVAGEETIVETGFKATRENLQNTDLTKYAILHFATHGILDPKRPEKSGLFLSTVNRDGQMQNGFVGLQDIYNLHAPVELVVLSACRTGGGKDVRGEGLIGLTRGFMYAGASSVVASLWRVDDEATANLMKQFYANLLQKGMTPAAALREAQNSIRQEKRWRSPYYWAAFTLQGEYRQVIKSKAAPARSIYLKVFVGAASLVLLLVAAVWYRRRRALQRAQVYKDSYSTPKT